MTTLRKHQQRFAAAVWASEMAQTSAGMAAYRRSVRANLAGAVQMSYPVIARIVGPDFLAEAARAYVEAVPSASGDLNQYGDRFDQFLASYPPAASLPYLPDVATLEWQVQTVLAAEAGPRQDLQYLAQTPPDEWASLTFTLDPAHRLLASRWPLTRLWALNQPDYDGDFSVDFSQAQYVLIHRRGQDAVTGVAAGVVIESLDPAIFTLLQSLAAGVSLGEAVERALADEGVAQTIGPTTVPATVPATAPATAAFPLADIVASAIRSGLLRTVSRPG